MCATACACCARVPASPLSRSLRWRWPRGQYGALHKLVLFLELDDVDSSLIRFHLPDDFYLLARKSPSGILVVEPIHVLLGRKDEISTMVLDAVERAICRCDADGFGLQHLLV